MLPTAVLRRSVNGSRREIAFPSSAVSSSLCSTSGAVLGRFSVKWLSTAPLDALGRRRAEASALCRSLVSRSGGGAFIARQRLRRRKARFASL